MRAIRYLASILLCVAASASHGETRVAESPQTLYLLHCSGCHGGDGAGSIAADVPPLPGYIDALLADKEGRRYVVNVGGMVSTGLADDDAAKVLNWIIGRFGGQKAVAKVRDFTPSEVHELRKHRPPDSAALRRQIVARLKQRGLELSIYPWP